MMTMITTSQSMAAIKGHDTEEHALFLIAFVASIC